MKKVYILPKLKLLKTVTHSNIVAREFEEDGGEGWESFTGTVTNWTKGQLKAHAQKHLADFPYEYAIHERRIETYQVDCPYDQCTYRTNKCEGRKYRRYNYPLVKITLRRPIGWEKPIRKIRSQVA